MKVVIDMDKSALVLGGGSHYAIAWQLGYLKGMSDCGIELRDVKEVVGTSAGAQVGALITSDLHWNTIWEEQIEQPIQEDSPLTDEAMAQLQQKLRTIAQDAETEKAWVNGLSTLSKGAHPDITQTERFEMIRKRLGSASCETWPKALHIAATESETNARHLFSFDEGEDLIKAVTASSAFPGVWAPVEMNGRHYYDGASYSAENADLAKDTKTVVILAADLPIAYPYALDELVDKMRVKGQRVRVVTPDKHVKQILTDFKENAMNPKLRTKIAEAGVKQGYNDVDAMYQFWNQH